MLLNHAKPAWWRGKQRFHIVQRSVQLGVTYLCLVQSSVSHYNNYSVYLHIGPTYTARSLHIELHAIMRMRGGENGLLPPPFHLAVANVGAASGVSLKCIGNNPMFYVWMVRLLRIARWTGHYRIITVPNTLAAERTMVRTAGYTYQLLHTG